MSALVLLPSRRWAWTTTMSISSPCPALSASPTRIARENLPGTSFALRASDPTCEATPIRRPGGARLSWYSPPPLYYSPSCLHIILIPLKATYCMR
jgi:hypothetical protein